MQGYLVAFAGKPAPMFLDRFRALAAQDGVQIRGAILTNGPGCYNLAYLLDEANDGFTNALLQVLPMAKGERCSDPRLKVGEFVNEVEYDCP